MKYDEHRDHNERVASAIDVYFMMYDYMLSTNALKDDAYLLLIAMLDPDEYRPTCATSASDDEFRLLLTGVRGRRPSKAGVCSTMEFLSNCLHYLKY